MNATPGHSDKSPLWSYVTYLINFLLPPKCVYDFLTALKNRDNKKRV